MILNEENRYKKINKVIAKFRSHEKAFSSKNREEMRIEGNKMRMEIGIKSTFNFKRFFVECIMKLYNIKPLIKKICNKIRLTDLHSENQKSSK